MGTRLRSLINVIDVEATCWGEGAQPPERLVAEEVEGDEVELGQRQRSTGRPQNWFVAGFHIIYRC